MYFVINFIFYISILYKTYSYFCSCPEHCRECYDALYVFMGLVFLLFPLARPGACLPVGWCLWQRAGGPHRTVLIQPLLQGNCVLPWVCVFLCILVRLLRGALPQRPLCTRGAGSGRHTLAGADPFCGGLTPSWAHGAPSPGSRACGARRCSTPTLHTPAAPLSSLLCVPQGNSSLDSGPPTQVA